MSSGEITQRRGPALRMHILIEAKQLFLESGFDRVSMDAVAARAATSKRSVYAHFENKEALFLAVLDLVRDLHLQTLGTPEDHGSAGTDAVSSYVARFLQLLVWESQVRTCRLAIAEAERLPGSTYAYYETIFATTLQRLADHLERDFALTSEQASASAHDLVDRCVLPRLLRTLFGVEPPIAGPDVPPPSRVNTDVDVETIARIVAQTLSPALRHTAADGTTRLLGFDPGTPD